MPSVYVYSEELNALLFAVKHFPEATPNRWEVISELIRSQNVESPSPRVCLDQSLRGTHNITVYDLKNRENCKLVCRLIGNKYPSLLHVNIAEAFFKRSGKTAFKPVVLIPCKTECCGSKIKVDNRPSFLWSILQKGLTLQHYSMVNVLNVKQRGIQATKLQVIIAAFSQILLALMMKATYKLHAKQYSKRNF